MEHFHYHYDQITGIYLGKGVCKESPEEPGIHLLPAWTTDIEPPETAEGEAAFFLFGKWVVKPAIVEQIVEAGVLGLALKPEEKLDTLRALAARNIDVPAKALGFKDMADALTYIGENTQAGLDAQSLRDWRAVVNARLQEVYSFYAENADAPMPIGEEFSNLFATAPFTRRLLEDQAAAVVDPGIEEMNRVLAAAAEATYAKTNFTPEQVAAEMAKVAR